MTKWHFMINVKRFCKSSHEVNISEAIYKIALRLKEKFYNLNFISYI